VRETRILLVPVLVETMQNKEVHVPLHSPQPSVPAGKSGPLLTIL
jgi:hypothetical protein